MSGKKSVTIWQGLHDMNYYDVDHELLRFWTESRGVQPSTNIIWMSCDELVFGLVLMNVQVILST